MSLTKIATNIDAQWAFQALDKVNKNLGGVQMRLATGKRINSTEDDPAGYQLARGLERRARGLENALTNVTNAKAVLNIAEGGFQSIMDILLVIKEKAVQAADQSLNDTQRTAINEQVTALVAEIGDIVSDTTFNGEALIGGDYSGNFQVGEGASNQMAVAIDSASAASLSISSISVASASNASSAITSVDSAIDTLSESVQDLGEYKSRLSVKEATLSTAITNTNAVRSNIEDADLVKEQMELMKLQILQQTAATAFTQANTSPQLVLQLMR